MSHNYEPFTAVKAADGTLHDSAEAAMAHDRQVKATENAKKFVAAAGFKGRGKRVATDIVAQFIVWVESGRPEKAAAEAA